MTLPHPAQLPEETLDPENWDEMRALAHRMVDDMMTYLQSVRERPVWQPVPAAVKERLHQPLPLEPESASAAYDDFIRDVLPYPMGNIHPRFWGWVMGNGTVLGVLADMLAATMNPNMGGGNHAANLVELQVVDWCKEMLGYPMQASGLLVSGGSMANLLGLAVARNAKAGFDLRRQGLVAAPRRLLFYTSAESHSSVQKGIELLGLGSESLRAIPVDAAYQIDIAALAAAVAEDRAAGHAPVCVIASAGTTNTGAIDDLNRLADLCAAEGMWLHVDGAFGALAALSPALRPLLAGMERADSLAFDLHKWMYLPFEAGCLLVRDAEVHRRTFSLTPLYLAHGGDRGLSAGEVWFSDYGLQLTRGFRALKVWLSLKEHGAAKFGRLIQQNVDQAQYLAALIDASPDLERLAPVRLNVVCFRFRPPGLDETGLNTLNQELLLRLQESGIAAPSSTTLQGRFCLRVANTNHRSRREDFDMLVAAVIRLGHEIVQQDVLV